MKIRLMLAALAALALTACSDPHAGEKCVEKHDESYIWFSQMCVSRDYKTGACTSNMQIPHYDTRTVCDKWVPIETKPPSPR